MITTVKQLHLEDISGLLCKYTLLLETVQANCDIPGSFWGNPEAGLIGNRLIVREDTPIHSLLHEACHFICMDKSRREQLHTDAAGDYDEENAVCYLQLLLADYLPGTNRHQLMQEMDEWGYSFRLGSTRRWFEEDADDARHWLETHKIIDSTDHPTWHLRQ